MADPLTRAVERWRWVIGRRISSPVLPVVPRTIWHGSGTAAHRLFGRDLAVVAVCVGQFGTGNAGPTEAFVDRRTPGVVWARGEEALGSCKILRGVHRYAVVQGRDHLQGVAGFDEAQRRPLPRRAPGAHPRCAPAVAPPDRRRSASAGADRRGAPPGRVRGDTPPQIVIASCIQRFTRYGSHHCTPPTASTSRSSRRSASASDGTADAGAPYARRSIASW